ncbi:hypothetical protein [Actinoplanes sp. TFC3]|uniref:hypothetical protein n=1 Tax=Actinoplanes sp. TFC3 TaxID=1710355 RepID=UPI00083041A1|nr:hypothetical protein [Actinoplanes sp. TFC3]
MIVAVIIACEVGFWAILAAGLFARYILRRKRLGAVLLVCVPVTDLVLIAASIADLLSGAQLAAVHGLAAVYLGFSVAFGPDLVRWADVRFAHRFAGGPPPPRPPRYGRAKVSYEWRAWLRCLVAWAITCVGTAVLGLVSGESLDSPAVFGYTVQATIIMIVWFIGWPLRTTLSPPKAPVGER